MQKQMQWLKGAALALCAIVVISSCGADDDDGAAGAGASGGGGTIAPGSGTGGAMPTGGGGASGSTGAAGCGTESFAAIYQDILANPTYMCNSPVCHGKMTGQTGSVGNLELISKDAAYLDLVGKMSDGVLCGDAPRVRVMPGSAATSLLVQKLRGDTVMCGSVMPVTGTPVSDPELARISAWINAGACNN